MNNKSNDLDECIRKQGKTVAGVVVTLFLIAICAVSFVSSVGFPSTSMIYIKTEDQNVFSPPFQIISTILVHEVLASTGNVSISQNQSNDTSNLTSGATNQIKNAVNGSIVTLPQLTELVDRRH
jgi:hypothetical protein